MLQLAVVLLPTFTYCSLLTGQNIHNLLLFTPSEKSGTNTECLLCLRFWLLPAIITYYLIFTTNNTTSHNSVFTNYHFPPLNYVRLLTSYHILWPLITVLPLTSYYLQQRQPQSSQQFIKTASPPPLP